MKPYMNPEVDGDSNGSSLDQSLKEYDNQEKGYSYDLQLALGKIPYKDQEGGGRTLNIPKYLPEGIVPGPSFNGAHSIGEQCLGAHCGININPTAVDYMNQIANLPNSPIGVQSQIPGGPRVGNSSYLNPVVKANQLGGSLFNFITDPMSLKRYDIYSKKGQSILKNYLIKLKNN